MERKTCQELIQQKLKDRLGKIEEILKSDDPTKLNAFVLAYSHDPLFRAKTLELSTGSSSDGFLFFDNGTIEYYYMDWFDGASRVLCGKEEALLKKLFSMFPEFLIIK